MTSLTDTSPAARHRTPTGVLVTRASEHGTPVWRAARQSGITATDIAKITNPSDYGDVFTVIRDKATPLTEHPASISEQAEWGQTLENYVARTWAARNGLRVEDIGLVRHDQHPWMLASLDRLVTGGCDARCGVEVKTTGAWLEANWADGATPSRVNDQVQWQLAVTGLDHMHVAVLIGGQKLLERRITPDHARIDMLTDAATAVWDAVTTGANPNLPDWLLTESLLNQLHPDRSGETVVDGSKAADLLAGLAAAKAGRALMDDRIDELAVELVALLGEGDTAIDEDGHRLFTYKPRTSKRLDQSRLKADRPDVYYEYVVESTSKPTLVVSKGR